MKKRPRRLCALLLTAALCLSLGACGDKSGSAGGDGTGKPKTDTGEHTTLAQELGYGYLSEYQDLQDVDLDYINSVTAGGGKLYLLGGKYDDAAMTDVNHLYEQDMATGTLRELGLPELVHEENTNEYIMQLSMCADGSAYWVATSRYTFDPNAVVGITEEAGAAAGPGVPAEPEEAAPEGTEAPEPESEEPVPAVEVEPTAYEQQEYTLELLTDMVPIEDEPAEEPTEEEPVDPDTPEDVEPIYGPSEQKLFAKKCDLEGNVLQEIDLTEATQDLEYFYVQSMAQDQAGNLYLSGDTALLCFGPDGTRKDTIALEDEMYLESMTTTGDGTLVASGWTFGDSYGRVMFRLDGGALTPVELKDLDNGTNSFRLFPGDGSKLLLSDSTTLYEADLATGETRKLLSWLDCDVNGNYITGLVTDGADRIVVLLQHWGRKSGQSFEVGTLTQVPADQIPARTILTMGALYLDSNIQDMVIKFNRTNDTYRITLKDYSQYNTEEDYDAGSNQLDRDIISGSCPDILMLSGGNTDKYIAKGALLDLGTLMEADESFSREDLVAGPLKAFTREDKLYAMPYSFDVSTMYASAKLVGDRDHWTLQDMREVIAGLDFDETSIMFWKPAPAEFLSQILYPMINRFVDYGAATCSFDSQEFIDLLEMCALLPERQEDDGMGWSSDDEWSALQNGTTLLSMGYGVYSSYELKAFYNVYTPENGIVRIGYPVEGENGALLQVYQAVALSARCSDPKGAWSFLKTLVSQEAQSEVWNLPVNRKALETFLQEAMEPSSYVDENGETVYTDDTYYIGSSEVPMKPLTQAQADDFLAFIDGASIASSYDMNIMQIVAEESEAFFAGDKTAQETAKLIQNRAGIYLGETS